MFEGQQPPAGSFPPPHTLARWAPSSREVRIRDRCRPVTGRPSFMAASYGFLSTHPPTQCGLATFNSALAAQLTGHGGRGGVVRVTTGTDDERAGPGVVHTWHHRSV